MGDRLITVWTRECGKATGDFFDGIISILILLYKSSTGTTETLPPSVILKLSVGLNISPAT
jgi:hypothetical protein